MGQIGYFDEDNQLKGPSEIGDPLKKVTKAVDWEIFRPILNKVPLKEERKVRGRPAW